MTRKIAPHIPDHEKAKCDPEKNERRYIDWGKRALSQPIRKTIAPPRLEFCVCLQTGSQILHQVVLVTRHHRPKIDILWKLELRFGAKAIGGHPISRRVKSGKPRVTFQVDAHLAHP